jgi:hypothetical protein
MQRMSDVVPRCAPRGAVPYVSRLELSNFS